VEADQAVRVLSALAQEHRLAAFRLLVEAGRQGLAAGEIVAALGVAPSSASFHLAHLVNAGLATHSRRGRSIRYAPDYRAFGDLIDYLITNCSRGEGCGEVAGCGGGRELPEVLAAKPAGQAG